MSKFNRKNTLKIGVDKVAKIVFVDEKLDITHQECYLEAVDVLLSELGKEGSKFAWHFKDKQFDNLKEMSAYFMDKLGDLTKDTVSSYFENIKGLKSDEKKSEEPENINELVATLKTTHGILIATAEVLEYILKRYEDE